MNQPKSNSKHDLEFFLIKCSKNKQIYLWNDWRESNSDIKVNLKGIDLNNLNLDGIDLCRADLTDADLKKASFRHARLIAADLKGANLIGASLHGANLVGSDLRKAAYTIDELLKTTFKYALLDEDIQPHISPNLLDKKIKYGAELSEVKYQLKEIQKNADKVCTENESYKREVNRLEKREKELNNKLEIIKKEKEKETKNITKIIAYLGNMPKEIYKEQKHLIRSRFMFNLLAAIVFVAGMSNVVLLILNILNENKYHLPQITNTGIYLAYALTIVLPMVLLFLFLRQANIKTKEIDEINDKSIIRQQVKEALKSYDVILSGEQLKEKAINSIDRVLDKLFENGHAKSSNVKTGKPNAGMTDLHNLARIMDNFRLTSTN